MRGLQRMLLIVGLVSSGLVWSVLAAHGAHAACANSHVVQRGDWLAQIARTHNVSLAELYRLNPWLWEQYGGNVIYPGQVLCLPGAEKRSAVSLEIAYAYTPTNADEKQFNLMARGGALGKREVYPVLTGDAMETFTEAEMTNALTQAVNKQQPPVLVGIRNDAPNDTTYTLVTINRPAILDSLRITGTLPVAAPDAPCLDTPLLDAEGFMSPGVTNAQLRVNLEASNGMSYPFTVTHVRALSSAAMLDRCYTQNARQAGFALYPIAGKSNLYRMQIVLEEGELGPPGRGWARRCGSWRGGGGFYRFMYAWYGC